MEIILIATICHMMSGMTFCGEEVRIPIQQMTAGKVFDPTPDGKDPGIHYEPYKFDLTNQACKRSSVGMQDAQTWVAKFRPGYWIQNVKCIDPDKYVPSDHA